MADSKAALRELFAPNSTLDQNVLDALVNILQLFSESPEELFYKWESYVMKMKLEGGRLDMKTVQDFKRDLHDQVERDSRLKGQTLHSAHKKPTATPRAPTAGGDMFDMLDGMISTTPSARMPSAFKRKSNFDSPASKVAKATLNDSPYGTPRSTDPSAFSERTKSGEILDQINGQLESHKTPDDAPADGRVKLKANTDLSKMAYKGMAMKLSESSEILDDRIDSFTEIVQNHYNLPDTAFGNPAAQSTAEIVAVGRIAVDGSVGKLTPSSIVLETSRRMGAGLRIPLRVERVGYDFFPGKIVALRGTNVSGEYFTVSEVLEMPLLLPTASTPAEIDTYNDRLKGSGNTRPLSILVASGPFTPDTNLGFEALHTVLDKARDQKIDVLILTGPFMDVEHPMVASGDFESYLPQDANIEPDRATLKDVFHSLISQPIQKLVQALPTITIILVPSVRDAVSSHVSWPQDRLTKPQLGLPKQCQVVTNPITLSINDALVGICSEDILSELRRENVYRPSGKSNESSDLLERLVRNVIEQRHFFPKFPAGSSRSAYEDSNPQQRTTVGACLDLGFLKLGEWLSARPDILIMPSTLNPFARVTENVVCINPGNCSKRKAAGSYASVTIHPQILEPEEQESDAVGHRIFSRARVDVVKV